MLCSNCNHSNDADAVFCAECGKPLGAASAAAPARSRKAYWFIVVLVPVLLLVGGLGYYKFFLPDGIAAVVNGENIKLSELDAEIVRTQTAPESVTGRIRYQMLNEMIAERLLLQAAIKANISVSRDEVSAAAASAKSGSGLDEKAFEQEMKTLYGSASAFERAVERDLKIKKFISEKIAPSGIDPMIVRAAVGKWLQEASASSTIRIALAENGSTAGCGGSKGPCNMAGGQQQKDCAASKGPCNMAGGQQLKNCAASKGPCNMAGGQQQKNCTASKGPCSKTAVPAASSEQSTDQSKAAEAAGLKYWHDNHGADSVSAKVTDFGCHFQVDIIKSGKNIASLRYQNGNITEL